MKNPRHILITGASSGIGAALAVHYAGPDRTLSLFGRDVDRLNAVAGQMRQRGGTAHVNAVSVTDQAGMDASVRAAEARQPLDLVIANAGVSGGGGQDAAGEAPDQARHIFDVNINGALNTIEPALPAMAARGSGQVALMSSLAGYAGWPGAPAYSASKGMIRLYGDALRGAVATKGIQVNVICPGFIRTPMTADNPFPMPFLMDADKAAKLIVEALGRNRAHIAFPWPVYLGSLLTGSLPADWRNAILRRLPAKPQIPAALR